MIKLKAQKPVWLFAMLLAGVTVSTGSGCANMNRAQSGALVGTGVGSLMGAAIGSYSGNGAAGALIGGVTGAMAGTVIGDAEDAREERDQAISQRNHAIAKAQYESQQNAMNNFDLIRLTQSGVGDDVIVSMIHNKGGKFDLTTDSVIALRSSGVSDRVIVAAQNAPQVKSGDVIIVKEQPAVILEPAPVVVGGYWGPGYHRHHYHHHHRHGPSSRVGVSFGF